MTFDPFTYLENSQISCVICRLVPAMSLLEVHSYMLLHATITAARFEFSMIILKKVADFESLEG
ncbi:hypothetical protein H5410_055347 [Solanum commersonii]|uniref:Uncharacterized protein n=1 Tax=Solanum commersonii TaxID=4109 RepID=A0A9J5WIF6_SOLCO|nr:hypothetical protein H5410_055347 [Solanum commersonii]